MSREETIATELENKRIDWGAANIVCHEHASIIRDLLTKKWSVRLIWDYLCKNNNVTVNYNAFRKAVARWNKKEANVSAATDSNASQKIVSWVDATTEIECISPEEPEITKLTPVGKHEQYSKTRQNRKPRIADLDIETFNGNFD